MLQFDPEEISFNLNKVVKKLGLALAHLSERLDEDYGAELTISAITHVINRGTIRFQLELQILVVCGVSEI